MDSAVECLTFAFNALGFAAFPKGFWNVTEPKAPSCHAGSALRNHTDAFIRIEHGPAACDDRQSCMGCHEKSACNDCHLNEKPEWHSDAFCDPAGSAQNRDDHVRGAAIREGVCMECHATRFHTQCSECHTRGEWPR